MRESVKPKLGFGNLKAKNRKMNIENNVKRLERAAVLLSEVKHNFLWRYNSTLEINKRDIAEIKELVTNVELLLNGETAKDLPNNSRRDNYDGDWCNECDNPCVDHKSSCSHYHGA